MLASGRPRLGPACAPVVVTLALCASCSSGNSKANPPGDASSSEADPRTDARSPVDAGHDVKKKPVDADAKVDPPRDASREGAGHSSGHDAGHDSGHAPLMGAHTSNVPITVTTANGTVTRTYDITLPASCSASSPVPLVFAFHGDGGNGAGMYSGFPIEAAAAAAGGQAIFVYPDGTDDNIDPGGVARAWDLYHDPGPPPYTYTPGEPVPAESDEPSGNADVDFFDTMVSTFTKNYCVDPSRIFITGMSSGGYLSNQFARWRSTIVKGTAPQSGGAPFGNPDSASGTWSPPNYCISPLGKVPALIIHGLADGTVDPCNAIEAQSYWELTNGCTGSSGNCTTTGDSCTGSNLAAPSSAPTALSPLNSLCQATSGCGGDPVVLCEIPGMGHSIWADAPAVIWSFFSSL